MKNRNKIRTFLSVAFFIALTTLCYADPRLGSVRIVNAPDSAVVFFDGTLFGKASTVLTDVSPGPHQLLVYAQGYGYARKDVTVKAGMRATCKIPLAPMGNGPVRISRQPAMARLAPLKHAGTHYTGRIYVLALVGTKGAVTSAEIVRGSGNGKLDAAIIETVKKSAFTAALAEDGRPVPDYVVVPFNFQ